MSKPVTRMVLILDKSGSMDKTKAASMLGFNEQVQQAKQWSQTQDLYCSLVTFNGDVYEHLWDVPAEQLVELTDESYKPDGGTAMLDAMGYTIQKLLETKNQFSEETAYLFIVISDGETNVDRHYKGDRLKQLITEQQNTGKWTFTYMGCSDQINEVAAKTGIPLANMGAWSNKTEKLAHSGFKNQNRRMYKYFQDRSMGKVATANFASDVSGLAADYMSDSSEATDLTLADSTVSVSIVNPVLAKVVQEQIDKKI